VSTTPELGGAFKTVNDLSAAAWQLAGFHGIHLFIC
jgi:hypothetical protein